MSAEKSTTPPQGGTQVDLSDTGLTPEQQKMLQAQIAAGAKKQNSKLVLLQKDKKETFAKGSIDQMAVVFFKSCVNCEFTVESRSTKVFIEDCQNCKFHFKEKVITQVMEVWKCSNVSIRNDTKMKTIQADLNKGLEITFDTIENFEQIIWASCEGIKLSFEADKLTMNTGLTEMKKAFDDILPDVDQFKISDVDGKLITERIVRLKGGYPSTNREADAFDAKVAANDKAYMAHVRAMVKENPGLMQGLARKGVQPAREVKKKVKPNAKCPCNSGKKYKKCCGDPRKQNRKNDTVVHTPHVDDGASSSSAAATTNDDQTK
mmetsp:Transcript_16855/g.25178  ORF Transcript_16855/g.25178 Transcript_16855/m.25178 type:complete len:320 (-) Transcript_16855:13-972(-)